MAMVRPNPNRIVFMLWDCQTASDSISNPVMRILYTHAHLAFAGRSHLPLGRRRSSCLTSAQYYDHSR